MQYSNIDFNKKTILITGGAGFIGSNLAFYFQENYPNSHVVIFDCFRSEEVFTNGNLQSFGHYKNLIGFKGDIICVNINNKTDLALLNKFKFDSRLSSLITFPSITIVNSPFISISCILLIILSILPPK